MKDKIYVDKYGQVIEGFIPEGAPVTEYIRKDALLEMLNEAIVYLSDGGLTGYYVSLAYQDMINKIESL